MTDLPVEGAEPGAAIDRRWWIAGAIAVLAVGPLTTLGPGTDLDVGAVLRSGRSIVEEGRYVASRAPGAPVHEAAVGALDALGGTTAANLGSLVAAIAVAVLLGALLRGEGVRRVGLSVAVVVANPWFVIAATSTVDFLWALGLWLGAAVVIRRRPDLRGAAVAGALAGLAVGARASTAFLVLGLVLAVALDHPSKRAQDRSPRRPDLRPVRSGSGAGWGSGPGPDGALARAGVMAGVALAVGLVVFLPPYLAADASLAFAQNDVAASSPLVQLGRFLVKDLYFLGPFAAVVLLVALPAVARAALRWRVDWLVRLGLLTVVISQLLFLRFPWKMGHLLPTLVGLALVLARALGDRPRLLAALVVAQLLYGAVSITLIEPDNPNAATGGRLTFEPRWGALVVDTQCRADDPGAWEGPGVERLTAVWDCAKPWAR